MKRPIAGFIFASCLMVLTPLYAATQTLTTYYPAPLGSYNNMTVSSSLTLTPNASGACGVTGTDVILVDNAGVLQICDKNNSYSLSSFGNWTGTSNLNMYPAIIGQHVDIGAIADLGTNLGVTGSAKITGATEIDGNTILGSAAANTTTVNGSLSVSGNTTLSGNTTIDNGTNITICAGGNCGTLQLTYSGGNYYAVATYN